MNKADPDKKVRDFVAGVSSLMERWDELEGALKAKGVALSMHRGVAADTFMTLAISWEAFMSSWFISAVNRTPDAAVGYLEKQIVEFATGKLNLPPELLSSRLILSSHLKVSQVAGLMDEKEENVTFKGFSDYEKKCDRWLAGPCLKASRSLKSYDWSTVECVRVIRNVFAHHSTSSTLIAGNQLKNNTNIQSDLRWVKSSGITVNGLRVYLYSPAQVGGDYRLVRFADLLKGVARSLILG